MNSEIKIVIAFMLIHVILVVAIKVEKNVVYHITHFAKFFIVI